MVRPNMGDYPEDRNWFLREGVEQLINKIGKNPIDNQLLTLAEVFIMAPQQVVPIFAKPFKVTTREPNGLVVESSKDAPYFSTAIGFTVDDGYAAVVTCLSQRLESISAYANVNIRLFYRGETCPHWYPHKPETVPVCIVLFEKETLEIQIQNDDLLFLPHIFWGEILGYEFACSPQEKSQYGVRVPTKPAVIGSV